MEKFFDKLETKFNSAIEQFEKNPLKTTIKWVIIIYISKKIWNMLKEEETK